MKELPSYDDVKDAAARLRGVARRTPFLENPLLNERLGCRLFVKAEPLQLTGAFKIRGAYNYISRLGPEAKRTGVITYSSGNHAQGVALAAKLCGVPATVVMPEDAPPMKIANTKAYGAEVVLYDRYKQSREDIAGGIAQERGAPVLSSYDDFHIIAGQGTAGLEIVEQARELNATLDAVLIPCGGGGLSSGCALALKHDSPSTEVYTVEPEAFDDTKRSLETGIRQKVVGDPRSVCDALLPPMPGELTFAILKSLGVKGLSVGDDEALNAMAVAFRYFKIVVEPGGAVALAAVLGGRIDCAGKTIAAVCSGGNVEASVFRDALNAA
ncbi:MAG: threonine/serine dehydratase [Rhodospirillales bacterium]